MTSVKAGAAYIYKTKVIAEIVRFQGKENPDKVALIFKTQKISYKELDEKSNMLANLLISIGLSKQSCVSYFAKESPYYYILLFACAKAGLILVPINWRLKSDELIHILNDSNSQILIANNELSEPVDGIYSKINNVKSVIWFGDMECDDSLITLLEEHSNEDPLVEIGPHDIFTQMYTSGTTGLPKGVRLKHHAFFEVRESLIVNQLNWLDWLDGDINLIGIPGFHIGGLWWAIQGFSAGITNVSLPYFLAKDALQVIQQHKVTQMCVVPSMINLLIQETKNYKAEVGTLRKIVYGGSPISSTLLEQGLHIFQCDFAQIYGLTETGNTAVCLDPLSHLESPEYLRAAGRPYPCVELKVINKQGNQLRPNVVGEVCIKTPASMEGYWALPAATESTLQDGWIHTGDAGFINELGYLFISDRIKDVIISAGENIYPTEVESVISRSDIVFDCAVIGVPDKVWGESVIAFIVTELEKEASQHDLYQFLKPLMADFKIPRKFYFVDELPRNPSGKILRRELREMFWEGQPQNI